MAEARKEYRFKEEYPEKGKFHSNAEDAVFYEAEPLTEEQQKKAARMWDTLAVKSSQGKKIPAPGENK
jgi:hypothetical protein